MQPKFVSRQRQRQRVWNKEKHTNDDAKGRMVAHAKQFCEMQKTKTQKDKSTESKTWKKPNERKRERKEEKKASAIYTITTLHIISSYVLQHYYLTSSIPLHGVYDVEQCIHILSAFSFSFYLSWVFFVYRDFHFHFCLLCNSRAARFVIRIDFIFLSPREMRFMMHDQDFYQFVAAKLIFYFLLSFRIHMILLLFFLCVNCECW